MTGKKLAGVLLLLGAVVIVVSLSLLAVRSAGAEKPVLSMPIVVILAVAAVVFVALGLDALLSATRDVAGEPAPAADYRHTYRLFTLIACVVAGGLVARWLAIPATFGEFGFFRGGAVDDARAFEPRHAGSDVCGQCHEEQARLHDKDMHANVACETCHGPGAKHAETAGDVKPRVPKGPEGCLVCHTLLPSRPGPFPQVDWRQHFRFVGVKDESTACTQCHDPHEPLFLEHDMRQARLHPLTQRCRDCHIGRGEDSGPLPESHPVVFRCSYCHEKIAAEVAKRHHRSIECTSCHNYSKVSASAERIARNGDPRFCLLCHRAAAYRSSTAAPGIEWPAHLDDVGGDSKGKPARCIDCHQDKVHNVEKGTSG